MVLSTRAKNNAGCATGLVVSVGLICIGVFVGSKTPRTKDETGLEVSDTKSAIFVTAALLVIAGAIGICVSIAYFYTFKEKNDFADFIASKNNTNVTTTALEPAPVRAPAPIRALAPAPVPATK
jgi:hypothetical protein